MLSSKLAVSLLSLTLLLTLAGGTIPTHAAEFGVDFVQVIGPSGAAPRNSNGQVTGRPPVTRLHDISHQPGLQIQRPIEAGDINGDSIGGSAENPKADWKDSVLFIRVDVKFAQPVVLPKSKVKVTGYGPDGGLDPRVVLADIPAGNTWTNGPHHRYHYNQIPGGNNSVQQPQRGTREASIYIALNPYYPAVVRASLAESTRSTATRVRLKIEKGIASSDLFNPDTSKEFVMDVHLLDTNPEHLVNTEVGFQYRRESPVPGPDVYRIALLGTHTSPITAPTVQVEVLLSEEPRGGFRKELVEASEADVQSVEKMPTPTTMPPIVNRGGGRIYSRDRDGDLITVNITSERIPPLRLAGTWRDRKIHLYLVTIKPKTGNKTVVIKVKNFDGWERPTGSNPQESYVQTGRYIPPKLVEGRDILTLKTNVSAASSPAAAKLAGLRFALPKDKVIPANGYLVVAEEKGGSAIKVPPGDIAKSPNSAERTPVQRLYNVIDDGDLPNLETFLSNGGVIDVIGPRKLTITEVMWGSDASLDDTGKSQWIELHNPGGEYKTQDGGNTTYLVFYNPSEFSLLPAKSSVHDRMGTVTESGAYWSIAGKGQSGRSGQGEQATDLAAVGLTVPLISMYRVADSDGRMASSWKQSTPPSLNFDASKVGTRVGSPGAARLVTQAERDAAAAAERKRAADAAAAAERAADKSVSMPKVGQIYISEVMFAGGGTLPQWIEIANGSRTEQVNLGGWTLKIENAAADADVSVGSIMFTLPNGTMIEPSAQKKKPSTLLVVTTTGRNNLNGSMAMDQVINLWSTQQPALILAGVESRRYSLLSDMGFMITLAPPAPKAAAGGSTPAAQANAKAADARAMMVHAAATDKAGNLGSDGAAMWDLPMAMEGGRSSLIRAHTPVHVGPAEPKDGMMMESWKLAADTAFAQDMHLTTRSYYGAMNDVGTPGFRAGGALPVELSSFRPERQDTGAVVITWSTQSELNNAGFFIKRSQQAEGEFKVINAVMVPGAGTTSEKQSYTYTDTTADPNVVYYYQIEDVSLDGQRETLTRGIRLRGHIGAAGKAAVLWGELKGSRE